MSHDKNGREYLKLSDAKAGQIVELYAGFTCAEAGPVVLLESKQGIYFLCSDGEHYIDGQANDGIHCIGIYP